MSRGATVTLGWKSFETGERIHVRLTTIRMWHLVHFTHAPEVRITFFTSLKRKKDSGEKDKSGFVLFCFSAEGYLTSCVVLFTVNWRGGRIEREEKCMSRLNEIVQRDLSAGTVFGTLVREMREWLRNGHPPKSDGENQFSKKIATKFHFQRGREISHRKSLDGNRWEAEPKPKFDQAMRTSTGVQLVDGTKKPG